MTKEEQNFNKWFDEYADGVKVFEETDMKIAYLQGCADEVEKWEKINGKLRTQLKQAKELLKRVCEWANWQGRDCPRFTDIVNEIRTFLKEM